MKDLTQPVTRQQAVVSPIRLTVLLVASLVAPIVLFAESARARPADLRELAVFSAVLYLLVLSRLWDVAASHRRVLGRERAVRQAGVSLVAAVSADQAAAAVKYAAATLLGTSTHEVLLAVRTDGAFRALAEASGGPVRMSRLGEMAGDWLPPMTGPAPSLCPSPPSRHRPGNSCLTVTGCCYAR